MQIFTIYKFMIIFEDYIMKRVPATSSIRSRSFPFDYGLSYTTFRNGTPELGNTLNLHYFVSLRLQRFR